MKIEKISLQSRVDHILDPFLELRDSWQEEAAGEQEPADGSRSARREALPDAPEKKPLREWLAPAKDTDRDRYRREAADKVPLNDRILPAKEGRFLDPSALVDMLKRSAEAPIREFLTEEQLEDVRASFARWGKGAPPATYGEGMRWIHKEWDLWSSVDGIYTYEDMPDMQYEYFLSLWTPPFTEVARRQSASSPGGSDKRDFTGLLPILNLPLPQYFQAVAESSGSETAKDHFLGLYRAKFEIFSDKEQSKVASYAKNLHSWQPHRDTSYPDVATMACVIMHAQKEKQISEKESIALTNELLILPFA